MKSQIIKHFPQLVIIEGGVHTKTKEEFYLEAHSVSETIIVDFISGYLKNIRNCHSQLPPNYSDEGVKITGIAEGNGGHHTAYYIKGKMPEIKLHVIGALG